MTFLFEDQKTNDGFSEGAGPYNVFFRGNLGKFPFCIVTCPVDINVTKIG